MEVMNTTSTSNPNFYYNYLNNFFLNPVVIIIILVIIVAFVIFSSSLGNESSSYDDSVQGNNIFGIIIVVILIILIIINAFQYFFTINVSAYIKGLFEPNAELDVVVDQTNYDSPPLLPGFPLSSSVPEIEFRKQVFNIPGNYYNYENAKALCKAYGSNLATYNQVENSYNSGGEWCNYGWSDGQMALFPTQKSTYNTLQNISGHEHDCGRPGVNGGYIANPEVKFGVNCYGNKPVITPEENELMKTMPRYPQNMQDIAFDKKVDYWKNQIDDILVSPFNSDMWTQI
jgi:hypothetical protein